MQLRALVLVGATLLLVSCGSSTSSGSVPNGYYIRIANMAFSPLDLQVPAGATITVVNEDSMDHSVTSEAAAGDDVPGSVAGVSFDTGPFVGQTSFALPAGVPEGTVIPYYCTVHRTSMATPTGTITINSSAPPNGTTGSGADGSLGAGYGGY